MCAAEYVKEDTLYLFFYPSDSSRTLDNQWWETIHEKKKDGEERKGFLTGQGARSKLSAIFSFIVDESNFGRLEDIKCPTLVTNGRKDIMSPTPKSSVLQQNIKNAHLVIYADAGHGHLFQVPQLYARHLNLFLEDA